MLRRNKAAALGAALIAAGLLAGCAYEPAPGPYGYGYGYGYGPSNDYYDYSGYAPYDAYGYGYGYDYGWPAYYGYGYGYDGGFGGRNGWDRDRRNRAGAAWNHDAGARWNGNNAAAARTAPGRTLSNGPAGHSVAHAPNGGERGGNGGPDYHH